MMIKFFAIDVETENQAGIVNSFAYDRVLVAADDPVAAAGEIRALIGKTYSELGWVPRGPHFRIRNCHDTVGGGLRAVDVYLPESFFQPRLEDMENRIMGRIMQYIDQVWEPREI